MSLVVGVQPHLPAAGLGEGLRESAGSRPRGSVSMYTWGNQHAGFGELDGAPGAGRQQCPGAWCPVATRCVMAPSKWPKTVLSALLPMNQLGASTGIFSAYSENILGVQAATGLFSADRFLQSLSFLAHGAGAELEVLGSFLGGSWHPCGRFPWAQSAMFAVS